MSTMTGQGEHGGPREATGCGNDEQRQPSLGFVFLVMAESRWVGTCDPVCSPWASVGSKPSFVRSRWSYVRCHTPSPLGGLIPT